MTTGAEGLEYFADRYGFDDWRESRAEEALFVWLFFLGGEELPGRRAARIESDEAPGWPPATHSLWVGEEETSPPVRVDVYETRSPEEAREHLLRQLGEFESPALERRDGPGDVAFGTAGDRALVFARANLVVLVRNAGVEVASVEPVGDALDRLFVSPALDRSSVRPEIRRLGLGGAAPSRGAPAPLELEADDPLGRRVWFRLAAASGAFSASEGRVFYTPEAEGPQAVEVTAVNENLGAARETLEFEAG